MKQYRFGKYELATHIVGNKFYVSRLDKPAGPRDEVLMTNKDAIVFSFASVKSVELMIADLQTIKKNMHKVKLAKLLETIL